MVKFFQTCIEKTVLELLLCALVFNLATALIAQSQDAAVSTPASDRSQIEAVLKSYVSAYEHNDYAGVVKVWPDLESNKKESKKLKERLDRADISQTRLALDIEDVNVTQNTVLAHCKRSENYVQVEQSSYSSGDNTIGGMPAQRPGPSQSFSKRNVRKSGDTWILMRRTGNQWVISSMNDKKPR